MHIFKGNLEAIKASCFGDCDFGDEDAAQVCIDNSVRGSKECEDVRDEVTFVGMEVEPVSSIPREVNFLCCLERCFSFFCTFSKCCCVQWERGQNGLDFLGGLA